MLDLKLTKARLRDHFQYAAKYYLLAVCVAALVLNLAYTTTTPQTPAHLKVDIIMVGSTNTYAAQRWQQDILDILPEDQQEVNILSTTTSGVDDFDYMAAEMLMMKFAAREGDIYVFSGPAFSDYLRYGFMDLTEFIEAGLFDFPEGVDPYQYYYEGDDTLPAGVYMIPLNGLEGMAEVLGLYYFSEAGTADVVDFCLGITNYTENQDNALRVVQWLFENKVEYNPEIAQAE